MEPGTPFALLAAVQLFSVACCLTVGGGWFLPALRSGRSGLIAFGAAVLAAAETASGVALGDFDSRAQQIVRIAAGALIFAGAIGRTKARAVLALAGVLIAVVGGFGPTLAEHPNVLVGARALGGALLVASVIPAVRRSLLGKVIAAIMTGVVITSIGASIVASTALSRTFGRQQATQAATLAANQRIELNGLRTSASTLAKVFGANITRNPELLGALVGKLSADRGFALQVSTKGTVRRLDNNSKAIADNAALLDISRSPQVQKALATKSQSFADFLVARGKTTTLLAVGVESGVPRAENGDNPNKPPYVSIYAIPIDTTRVKVTAQRSSGNLTFLALPDGKSLASSLTGARLESLIGQARSQLSRPPPGNQIESETPHGSHPAAGYTVLQTASGEPVALLVASQSTDVVSKAQKLVLAGLFGALVGIFVLLAGLSFLLGRRLVDPIQRLTSAATAVRLGNSSVRAATDGRDEVGDLSRAFDEMTTSLVLTTDQLRTTAAEETLVRERLQTVLDSMVNPLLVIDPQGFVIDANPAATRLLRRDPRDERADATLVTVAGEPLLKLPAGIHDLLVDGAALPVAYTVSALPGNAGRVVVLRDVAAEREIERMKTEFLSNVSHELRTPLTPIKGYAEMLVRRDLDKDKIRSFAGTILASTQRMTRVVDLLVDVAALEAGRVQPRGAATSMKTTIDAAITRWAGDEPSRAKDLRRRVGAGVSDALVDPEWLNKALDEVIGNALKFSKPGTPVVISASTGVAKGEVRLTVKDRGIGMSEEVIADALSDFSQADGSATRRSEGLGLGLGFCRRLADVIGMRISIESELGKGTEVHLDLATAPSTGSTRKRAPRKAAAVTAVSQVADLDSTPPVRAKRAPVKAATKAPAVKTSAVRTAKATAAKVPVKASPKPARAASTKATRSPRR